MLELYGGQPGVLPNIFGLLRLNFSMLLNDETLMMKIIEESLVVLTCQLFGKSGTAGAIDKKGTWDLVQPSTSRNNQTNICNQHLKTVKLHHCTSNPECQS